MVLDGGEETRGRRAGDGDDSDGDEGEDDEGGGRQRAWDWGVGGVRAVG